MVGVAEPRGRLPAMTGTATRFRPAVPLVEAKLRPPEPRPGVIARARLVRLLAEPGPPVAAVIGPPGYGKTTLLAQWAAREQRPVAWLTLDDLDNDPAVMLSYLAVAFDRIEPIDASVRAGLLAPRERILGTAVPALASELHRWHHPTVLVLDDVHRLVDRIALDALAVLLDYLPPGVRVALAGRTEPDLPFARFRANQVLLEIGPGLLALDEAETAALAADAGLELTPADTRALAEQTEGWPAGTYLALLARGLGDHEPGPLPRVTGHDRYVADYVRSEVGHTFDDDDMVVLTRTAILESITPAVAEAVSGLPGAGERIRALARRNLLIQEIGLTEPTFRYHNLLREYLLAELVRREPGEPAALHHRAAAWYADAGFPDRAIAHAIASGHELDAARYLTEAWLPLFYSQPATLDRWLRELDGDLFERYPPLAVLAGWIHLFSGRADAAEHMAEIAERSAFDGAPGDGSSSFVSQRAMILAVMARRGPEETLRHAEVATGLEPPGHRWRATALLGLGLAHLMRGDVDAAAAAFSEPTGSGPSTGWAVREAMRASLAMARGDWDTAAASARASLDFVMSASYGEIAVSLITYAVAARVAVNAGDLARARALLVRAQLVRPLVSHGMPGLAVASLLELARAYLGVSDPAGAQLALREAERIVRRRPALGRLTDELLQVRRRVVDAASTLAGSSTLTNAELRVLPLLPTYLSFQEIADRLVISRNTVKTHAMSIYGKLQASSRGEAVERAVELGLLEPYPVLGPRRPAPAS